MHTQKYWIFQNWKKIIHINLFLLSFLLNFLTFVTCLWHFFLGQFHVFLRKCHTFYSYIFYKFSIIDLRNILEDEIDVEWFNASKKSFSLKTIEVEFGNRTELYQIINNGMVERVKSIPSSLCGDLVCHSWWTHYAREQRYYSGAPQPSEKWGGSGRGVLFFVQLFIAFLGHLEKWPI